MAVQLPIRPTWQACEMNSGPRWMNTNAFGNFNATAELDVVWDEAGNGGTRNVVISLRFFHHLVEISDL